MPAAHALFGTADAHTAAIVRSLYVCGASGTRECRCECQCVRACVRISGLARPSHGV